MTNLISELVKNYSTGEYVPYFRRYTTKDGRYGVTANWLVRQKVRVNGKKSSYATETDRENAIEETCAVLMLTGRYKKVTQ
jgi:hypothetical protein